MGAVTLTNDDLAPFAAIDDDKADAMIVDTLARAAAIAPCIVDEDFENDAAAKAIIRGAILRWHDAGSGGVVQETDTTGPFTTSKTFEKGGSERRGLFWPSEIAELQKLCASSGSQGAFAIDTVACITDIHSAACALRFGATYCSCGADLAGFPIYELDE